MKVYSKIVLDIETGNTLYVECSDYSGPLALCNSKKKKQKTQTQVTIPPPTAEETKARQLQDAIQTQNLYDAGYTTSQDASGNWTLTKREQTDAEKADAAFNQQLQDYVKKQILNPGPSDEQKALVQQTYDASRQQGTAQIDAFAREQAGARGLDLTTDSPAMRESYMAKSNLETGLGGAQASSLLNIGQQQQLFASALQQFQSQLQQQKFINQSAVAGQYGGTGMQLAGIRGMEPNTLTIGQLQGGPSAGLGALNGFFSGLSNPMSGPLGAFTGALGGGLNAKN